MLRLGNCAQTRIRHPMTPVSQRGIQTLVLLLCILGMNVGGLFVFCRGFLLSRPVFDKFSPSTQVFDEPLFDRVVILVVDALRYEFAADPHESFPVLHEIAQKTPENAVLLKFLADPPTTTLQRLKGLTTGSLPTFIDAGSNFAGTAILEDNWVDLLKNANKSMAFVGDDTWTALYPDQFDFSRPFPSLEVHDLDTVDNGVKAHFSNLVENTSYSVVIGHMLGVDHAGHTFGPQHQRMASKLNETNDYIREIIPLINEKTLFAVFGDHGMDPQGDHGGDSQLELEAALWMYSKAPIFRKDLKTTENTITVSQIDLVPTLCLALGHQPPYNNLGFPIDVFNLVGGDNGVSHWQTITADQIEKYISQIPELQSTERSSFSSDAEFQHSVLDQLREIWVRFDAFSMIAGLVILSLALFMGLLLISSYTAPLEWDLFCMASTWCVAIALFGAFMGYVGASSLGPAKTAIMLFVLNFSLYLMYTSSKGAHSLSNWKWIGLAIGIAILHAASQSSNSFVVWEMTIVPHLLNLFCAVALICGFQIENNNKARRKSILYCVFSVILTKLSSLSVVCREEHGPICRTTFYSSGSSVSPVYHVAVIAVAVLLFPMIFFEFYNATDCMVGSAGIWKFGSSLVLMLSVTYWSLYYLDAPFYAKAIISRVGLGITLVAANYIWARSDLCVQIRIDQNKVPRLQGYANVYASHYGLLILNFLGAILIVSKPSAVVMLLCMMIHIMVVAEICHLIGIKKSGLPAIICALLAIHYFYATGHQATIPSVQWDMGFVATQKIVLPITHLILVLNSLGTLILGAFAAVLIPIWRQPPAKDHEVIAQRVALSGFVYILYFALLTFCTTLYAALLRRHLMVWKIFAPRFMLAAISLPTVVVATILAYAGVWITIRKVAAVYGSTSKPAATITNP